MMSDEITWVGWIHSHLVELIIGVGSVIGGVFGFGWWASTRDAKLNLVEARIAAVEATCSTCPQIQTVTKHITEMEERMVTVLSDRIERGYIRMMDQSNQVIESLIVQHNNQLDDNKKEELLNKIRAKYGR